VRAVAWSQNCPAHKSARGDLLSPATAQHIHARPRHLLEEISEEYHMNSWLEFAFKNDPDDPANPEARERHHRNINP
jgi:hypothetical protein